MRIREPEMDGASLEASVSEAIRHIDASIHALMPVVQAYALDDPLHADRRATTVMVIRVLTRAYVMKNSLYGVVGQEPPHHSSYCPGRVHAYDPFLRDAVAGRVFSVHPPWFQRLGSYLIHHVLPPFLLTLFFFFVMMAAYILLYIV